MAKYLDSVGVKHLWDRIKAAFVAKSDLETLITSHVNSIINEWEQKTTDNNQIDTFKEVIEHITTDDMQSLTNDEIDDICSIT